MDGLPCNFCGQHSKTMCGNCWTPYCSIACQRNHWLTHKFYCYSLHSLHNSTESITPLDLCGQLGDKPKENELDKLESGKLRREPSYNSIESEPLASSSRWVLYKGYFAHESKENKLDKLDSGKLIRKLSCDSSQSEPLTFLPRQAWHEDEPAKNVLHKSEPGKVQEDVKKEEELIELKPSEYSNQKKISLSKFTELTLYKTKYFYDAIVYTELPKTSVIQLVVVNTVNIKNSLITVRDFKNQRALDELQENLEIMADDCCQTAKKFPNGYAPRCGELCLVFNHADYYWYRAVCFNVCPDGDNFELFYLDYGDTCAHTCRLLNVLDTDEFCRQQRRMEYMNFTVAWNTELRIYEISPW